MNEEIVREITVLNEALENAEAEIGRLRATLRATREPGAPAHRIFAELRAEVLRLKTLWEECEKDNKQLEAEVEKLRRDNDLLREALRNG